MGSPLELRCWCNGKPLLGVCGRDAKTGEPFVHVRVFKQSRIFGEIVATGGTVRLRCRNCLRWHKVIIRTSDVVLREEQLPETVALDAR